MFNYFALSRKEPYRLFFPLGVLFLLWGALIWLPLIWGGGGYPVLAHRYLMLNGFVGCFIGGFLMTAVPKFSQTTTANLWEVFLFLVVTVLGVGLAYGEWADLVFLISSLQALIILFFLFSRILKRRANPPYSFVFIFVGLFLWLFSGLAGIFFDAEAFKHLHYEGAIASIILGVGSRLIPGILGHVEIVNSQRAKYEKRISVLKTVPLPFFLIMLSFVVSYFLSESLGRVIRAFDVLIIGFMYWRLWKTPVEKTALTWSIWSAAWLVVLSFVVKAFTFDGLIHMSHFFFIGGVVLLSLLIATRVLQSHGPKDKTLEQSNVLYFVTGLIILAAATRVSAYLLPDLYLSHLGYSSLLLSSAVIIWSIKYLWYIFDSHP
jgi:uncharacterized protein involved in response to NO